jgi:hypothetical protein
MAKQTINIGASPNDGTGTPLRTSFDYTNQNFTELYTALGGGVGLPGATTQVIFNDGGTNLAGDAGLVYNKTTDALTVAGLVTAGSATITGDLTVDTSTLKVDSTNNRVGIGTATPTQALSVAGAIDFKNYVAHMDNFAVYANATDGTTVASFTGYPIGFRIANVEVGRINTTGNLVLKGGTAGATGVGVTFPAAQVASSDANCLDDYEEGTFTPTIVGSTTAGTVTYATRTGYYTKIGRIVQFQIFVAWSAGAGGTGDLRVAGLPFTANITIYTTQAIYPLNVALTAGNIAVSQVQPGDTYIGIIQIPTGGGADTAVPYDPAGQLIITGTYMI